MGVHTCMVVLGPGGGRLLMSEVLLEETYRPCGGARKDRNLWKESEP